MSKYTRRIGASLTLGAVVFLGACRADQKKGPDSALAADSTLNRDLSLAGRDTTAQPQLKDVPANTPAATPTPNQPVQRTASAPRPTPRNPAPTPTRRNPPAPTTTTNRPAPVAPVTTPSGNTVTTNSAGSVGAAAGGAVGTIPAGATLNLASTSRVCTNTNAVGDRVTATVNQPVMGSNGAVIPAGATVSLTVTKLKRSENTNDPILMEFAVNSVSYGGRTYPLDAVVASASVDRVKDQPQSKDVQKVVGGAIIGGIAGRILGKGTKGAVIGAAAGAAAGAAGAAATANYQGCIPTGGSIVVRLSSAAQVRV